MRMAYLILAHENEAQLDALCERLVPPGSSDIAIIHCDARSGLWKRLRKRPPDPDGRITILRHPVAVRWGHRSQVEAIRRLIRAALRQPFSYAHLISGADWPAVSREAIAATIREDGGAACYIESEPSWLEERMQTFRLDSRWLRVDPRRNRIAYSVTWQMRRISRWMDRRRKRARPTPYGRWQKGATWWSLPRDVLQIVDSGLALLAETRRLSGTVCADEHAVQTIVASACPDRIVPNRRFVDFPNGMSSPRLLSAQDRPAIAQSGAWFMRKVSLSFDPFFAAMPGPPEEDDAAPALAG